MKEPKENQLCKGCNTGFDRTVFDNREEGEMFTDGRGIRYIRVGGQSKQLCEGDNYTCLSTREDGDNLCRGHKTGFKKYRLEGLEKGDITVVNGELRKFNGIQHVKMCDTEGCDITVSVSGMCKKHSPEWRCKFTGEPCTSIRTNYTNYCQIHRDNIQHTPEKSLGENRVAEVLDSLNIKYISNKAITDSEGTLYPDFQIPVLNTIIEFDGKQHFVPVKYWKGDDGLAYQIICDLRKDAWVIANNMRMLRIPHDEIENIDIHIHTFLALLADSETPPKKIFSPAHPVYEARGYSII